MGKRVAEKPHGEDPEDSGEVAMLEMELRRHREHTGDRFAQLQAFQSSIEASIKSWTEATQASIAGLQLLVRDLDRRVSTQVHPPTPPSSSSLGQIGPIPRGKSLIEPLLIPLSRGSPNWVPNPNSTSTATSSPMVVYSEPLQTQRPCITSAPYPLGCEMNLDCAVGGWSVGSSLSVNAGSRNLNYGESSRREELWSDGFVQDCGDGVRIVDMGNVRNVCNRNVQDTATSDFQQPNTGFPQYAQPTYSTLTTTRAGPELATDCGRGPDAGLCCVHQGGYHDQQGRRGLQDMNEQWGQHRHEAILKELKAAREEREVARDEREAACFEDLATKLTPGGTSHHIPPLSSAHGNVIRGLDPGDCDGGLEVSIGVVCDANGVNWDMFKRTGIGVVCDAIKLNGDRFNRTGIGVCCDVWVSVGIVESVHFPNEIRNNGVGEKILAAVLKKEIAWFDQEENESTKIATRLSLDASNVRSAIGDRISVIKMFMTSFSGDLEVIHAKVTQLAGEAVADVRAVAAFNSEGKIVGLFSSNLQIPLRRCFWKGQIAGSGFWFAQFPLYSSYALGLWVVEYNRVDAEEQPEIPEAFGVAVVSFFVFAKDGKIADKLEGAGQSNMANKVAKLMRAYSRTCEDGTSLLA